MLVMLVIEAAVKLRRIVPEGYVSSMESRASPKLHIVSVNAVPFSQERAQAEENLVNWMMAHVSVIC